MNFEQWKNKRAFYTHDSCDEEIREQLDGMGFSPKSDIVIIYPAMAFILVIGSSFEVILGNDDPVFDDLNKAELYLWKNWVRPQGLHRPLQPDLLEIIEAVMNNGPEKAGKLVAQYVMGIIEDDSPIMNDSPQGYWVTDHYVSHFLDSFNAFFEED